MRTFGYSAKGEIIPEEAEIVKYVYNKQAEYEQHPPEHLVREVIADFEERGERITYADAEKKVGYDKILEAISIEVNAIWENHLSSLDSEDFMISCVGKSSFKCVEDKHIPIVDKDTYNKAKAIIKQRNA